MHGWMKCKLESRLQGEISISSDSQIYHPYGRKQRRTKKPLDESEKVGLKLNIQKTKTMASVPITSWQIDGKTMETVRDYIWGLQNHGTWRLHVQLLFTWFNVSVIQDE